MCTMAKNIEQSLMICYIATSLPPLLADTAHWHPAHAPWHSIILSVIFLSGPAHFWLVVASPLSAIPPADIQVHDFISDFYHPLTWPPPKTIVSCFPRTSCPGMHPKSILPYVTVTCFWLVVVWLQTDATKSHNVFIYLFYRPPNLLAKMIEPCPLGFRPPSPASAIEPPYHFR